MKGTKRKTLAVVLGVMLFICLAVIAILQTNKQYAFAASLEDVTENGTNNEEEKDYIITYSDTQVNAIFTFTKLNDTECSVRLSNKSDATKAIIPSTAEIDGVKYSVTEIATNGFASASKLERVKLPSSIKKIGNSAFNNCPELNRISIGKVEEIGNSAFAKCPKLEYINIPKTVIKMGTTIFRNNTTQVYMAATEISANWTASWNNYNNGEVFLGQIHKDKKEFEIISNPLARADNAYLGAVVASGQPDYYNIEVDEGNNIFKVPANIEADDNNTYDVIAIDDSAFYEISVNVFVEYNENPIYISSYAFDTFYGDIVYFNREIIFKDYVYGDDTNNIFSDSHVKGVVLPSSLKILAENMFYNCNQLSNIFFETPNSINNDKDLPSVDINGVIELGKGVDNEGKIIDSIAIICDGAFSYATSINILHLYSNIEYVGYGLTEGWENEQSIIIHASNLITKNWDSDWDYNEQFDDYKFPNIEYTSKVYVVTLDAQGGKLANSINEIKVEDGELDNPLLEPKKEHYDFLGWAEREYEKDTSKYYNEEKLKNITSDLTLYAQWKAHEYEVTLYDGDIILYMLTGIKFGSNMPIKIDNNNIPAPKKYGYDCIGFYTRPYEKGDDNKGKKYYDVVVKEEILSSNETYDDITLDSLYAHWIPQEYTIELFDVNGSTTGVLVQAVFDEKLKNEDVKNKKLVLPEKDGYEFIGYYTSMNGLGIKYYGVTPEGELIGVEEIKSLDIKALFPYMKPISQDIKIIDEMNGTEIFVTATFGSEMPTVDKSGNTLIAPKSTGYEFFGFYSKIDGEYYYDQELRPREFKNLEVDELYAAWIAITYSIRYPDDSVIRNLENPNQYKKTFTYKEYYQFKPIYDKTNHEVFVWDVENTKDVDVLKLVNRTLEVSGKWEKIDESHTTIIRYDYNGGEAKFGEYPTSIKYYESKIIGEPYKFRYSFEGWYVNGEKLDKSTLTNRTEEEIVLVAKWGFRSGVSRFIAIPENVSIYTITANGNYMMPTNYPGKLDIIIEPGVTSVHLYKSSRLTYYYNTTITIKANKYGQCDLYLENLYIKAPDGQAAIYMCYVDSNIPSGSGSSSSKYVPYNPYATPILPDLMEPTFPDIKPFGFNNSFASTYDIGFVKEMSGLNLYAYGKVVICGGDSKKSSINAGCGIFCENLHVRHADDLLICGGDAEEIAGDAGYGITAVYTVNLHDYDVNFNSYTNVEVNGGNKIKNILVGNAIIKQKIPTKPICILSAN